MNAIAATLFIMLVDGLFVYRAWHYLQYITTIPCDCDLSLVEVSEQILNIFYTMLMATLNSNHLRIWYLDISIRQAENNGIFSIAHSKHAHCVISFHSHCFTSIYLTKDLRDKDPGRRYIKEICVKPIWSRYSASSTCNGINSRLAFVIGYFR